MKLGTLELNPLEIGSQGNAVLGIRDSGKSYTATLLAEQLFDAGIPFIAFDPIGVWRYMRVPGRGKGYPIVVAGGQEGDLPLSPQSAPLIVEAAMQNGVSLVIDLYDMKLSKADWRRIVRDCVRLLLHRNGQYGLRHVFLEEAAEFAPQRVLDGDVYAEIEKLARMGGNARLGYTLINQRAQEVNKAVLELCDNLFLHRQKGKNALDSLKKWLELAGATGSEVMSSLPTLPQGECWAWLAGSALPVHWKVPEKNSLHPDRRQMHGEAMLTPKKAVKVDKFVAALQKTLPQIEEEAIAKDPAKLRARVAQLERELSAKRPPAEFRMPTLEELRKLNSPELARLRDETFSEGFRRAAEQFAVQLRPHMEAIARLSSELKLPGLTPPPRRGTPAPAPIQRAPIPAREQPVDGNGAVPSGCAKPLAVLAGAYPAGLTESQWSMAAGYKKSGGTWLEYRRRLVRAEMIEKRDGLWYATELGANAAGDVELPPAPGPELVRWWAPKINAPIRVVEQLIEVYPDGLTRAELADRIEMAASGGSFQEYVRRMLRNSIAEERGGYVRLTDAVMAG